MNTSIARPHAALRQPAGEERFVAADAAWRPIYRAGGVAALLSVACIVLAIPVFLLSPPPTSVADWFALFHRNALLGLLDLDLLMVVAYALAGVVYVALFGALRRTNAPLMALGTIIGLVSVTTYFASNTAFNMLSLSTQYYAAGTTAAERGQLLGAGHAMLAIWQGTAYDVSYVLGGIAMLTIAAVMLRSAVFGRVTAYVGLVTGVLMLLPATVGTVGIVVSLVSLLPSAIWDVLIARRLFRLASTRSNTTPVAAAYSRDART